MTALAHRIRRMAVVDRARSAVGHGAIYKLGQGGMKPYRAVPWDDEHEIDCSGFAMWAWGISRFQDPLWYGTTRMVSEAKGHHDGLFIGCAWELALPGDGIAWPARMSDERTIHGHCGIVSEIGPDGPTRVIHASNSNWKTEGDAIQETGPEVFRASRAYIVRPRFIED